MSVDVSVISGFGFIVSRLPEHIIENFEDYIDGDDIGLRDLDNHQHPRTVICPVGDPDNGRYFIGLGETVETSEAFMTKPRVLLTEVDRGLMVQALFRQCNAHDLPIPQDEQCGWYVWTSIE